MDDGIAGGALVGEDARLDAGALEALGEEIAGFAVRIDVAEHALLHKLRLFDAHEAWAPLGFMSCAQWLSWRVGIGLTAAREKVRVARALTELSQVDALFGRGELSYSKVRAITRVATPVNEQDLIDIAMHATAAQVERLSRCYQRCVEIDKDTQLPPASQRRYVRRAETLGGMIKIEIQLPPEEAAVVWDAIEAAWDRADDSDDSAEAPERGRSATATSPSPAPEDDSAESRPAEATPPSSVDALVEPNPEQRRADALVDVARAYLQQRPRTRGSGYELVMLTSKDQLAAGPGGVGGFLRDGTPVPIAVARMLACDGGCVDVTVDERGELLDVGRRTRAIPAAIGRALWLRDGGCRVPGCGRRRHLHGHHIVGWAEGGATKLDNLALLCPGHHRMIHEGGLQLTLAEDGALRFATARGLPLSNAPARPISGYELDELERSFAAADLHLDPSVASARSPWRSDNFPRWDGSPLDLDEALTWLLLNEMSPRCAVTADRRSRPR